MFSGERTSDIDHTISNTRKLSSLNFPMLCLATHGDDSVNGRTFINACWGTRHKRDTIYVQCRTMIMYILGDKGLEGVSPRVYQVMRPTVDNTLCHRVVSGRMQRRISAGCSSHFGNSFTEIQNSLEPISRTGMRTCIFLAITVCPCAHGFVAKKYIATVSNWMTLGEFILPVDRG